MSSAKSGQPTSAFDRREFLKAGSIAALGLTLPASLLHAATSRDATMLPILSVGFTPDQPSKLGALVRLRPAKDLLTGDPNFLREGASIGISTFSRSPRFKDLPGGVEVEVVYPSLGFQPDDYPRFQAWGFRQVNGIQKSSGSLKFTVPVTSTDGLQMSFRSPHEARSRAARGAAPNAPAEQAVSSLALHTGVTSSTMKLQRGVYVIALRESADEREPQWTDQVLSLSDRGLVLNSASNFTYLVATVNFPKEH